MATKRTAGTASKSVTGTPDVKHLLKALHAAKEGDFTVRLEGGDHPIAADCAVLPIGRARQNWSGRISCRVSPGMGAQGRTKGRARTRAQRERVVRSRAAASRQRYARVGRPTL